MVSSSRSMLSDSDRNGASLLGRVAAAAASSSSPVPPTRTTCPLPLPLTSVPGAALESPVKAVAVVALTKLTITS